MEQNVLQLLGGSAFAYIVIKEVLAFLKGRTNGLESINLLREIKDTNVRNGDKLEAINRNMILMLERQTTIEKRVDEIRNRN